MGKFFRTLRANLQRYDSTEEPIINDSDLENDMEFESDFNLLDKVLFLTIYGI